MANIEIWHAIRYISCMFRATVVVFLLLIALSASASELANAIADLESAWAAAYYQGSEAQQKQAYPLLRKQAEELVGRYPGAAEPKIWQATIMVTNAGFESALTALSTLEAAKALLETAIQQNPKALDGAAYLTLGTLYYMVPGWPVSFGDNQLAEQMLRASLAVNPNGIDANYYYGDFLLQQDRVREAESYFLKASLASVRKQQVLSDSRLQQQAKLALVNVAQQKAARGKHKFQSLFTASNAVAE